MSDAPPPGGGPPKPGRTYTHHELAGMAFERGRVTYHEQHDALPAQVLAKLDRIVADGEQQQQYAEGWSRIVEGLDRKLDALSERIGRLLFDKASAHAAGRREAAGELHDEYVATIAALGTPSPFACDGCKGRGFHVVELPSALDRGTRPALVTCQACGATGRRDREGLPWTPPEEPRAPWEQILPCTCEHAESQHRVGDGIGRRPCLAFGCPCPEFSRKPAHA